MSRRRSPLEFLATLAQVAVVVLAIGYVAIYLYIALSRLNYPFELEWMEGGMIEHLRRILTGQQIYVPPSLSFTPFNYSPLYWWVSAGVAAVTGLGFLPLRLVSIAASIIMFVCIYLIVRDETKRVYPGLIAVGLFAATYRAGGAWFDVGRVDTLFLALMLIAVYLIRHKTTALSAVVAGLCIGASFLTKQIAIFMVAPIMLYAFFGNRRNALWLWMTSAVIIVGSTVVLMAATGGWYRFYTYDLLRSEGTFQEMYSAFWWFDIGFRVPLAFLLGAVYLLALLKMARRDGLFWGGLFVGIIGGTYVSRIHLGGYDNVLMPAYAVIAIIAALAVHWFVDQSTKLAVTQRALISLVVSILCIVQFAVLRYDIAAQIPTAQDSRVGNELVDKVKAFQGDVFVPSHPYLATMAGKPFFSHAITIWSVSTNDSDGAHALANEIAAAFKARRFSAVFTDPKWLTPELEANYTPYPIDYSDPAAFVPVTGVATRPDTMWLPKG